MKRINVVFDFDGSLATTFVGGLMFRGYTRPEQEAVARARFESSKTSLREYQEEVFDLVNQTPAEMSKRAANQADLRPFASDVCEAVWSSNGEVAVASSGLDFYISPVLAKANLERVRVHSGRVISSATDNAPFRYDYPSSDKNCNGDWVTCKCKVIRDLKTPDSNSEVVFVGDGTNADECAATNAADKVFASGRLLSFCQKNNIPVTEFKEDLKPVLAYVTSKNQDNGVQ